MKKGRISTTNTFRASGRLNEANGIITGRLYYEGKVYRITGKVRSGRFFYGNLFPRFKLRRPALWKERDE